MKCHKHTECPAVATFIGTAQAL